MTDDLSMLPADVQEAVSVADQWAATYEHGFAAKNAWATIRVELLRLARENAALQNTASRLMRENAELDSAVDELAKLRGRIAEAPVVRLHGAETKTGITGYFVEPWPIEMTGMRVALVRVEDEG